MSKYIYCFLSLLFSLSVAVAQNTPICPPQEEEDPNLFAASMGGNLKITGQRVSIIVVGEPISSGNLFSPIYRDSGFGLLSRGNIRPIAGTILVADKDYLDVRTVSSGSTVQVKGETSCDPDYEPINYSWAASSGISFNNPSSMNPTFVAPFIRGKKLYEIYQNVNDGQLVSKTDTVQFIISDPGWEVVTYTGSHTFRAFVKLNSLPADYDDVVGAFVGQECRGYAIIKEFFQGEAVVTINIQTETPEQVTFKVYDESTNQVCDVAGTYSITPNGDTPPVTINGTCALPADFLALRAISQDKSIDISWETALEWEVDKYMLERSEDGKTFTPIYEVGAQNKEYARYEYQDEKVSVGTTYYYRVKTVDFDGSTVTSFMVSATLDGKSDKQIQLFPNPTTGNVQIVTNSAIANPITVEVYDNIGRLLQTYKFNDLATHSIFDLSSLPAGIYTIHLTGTNLKQIERIALVD